MKNWRRLKSGEEQLRVDGKDSGICIKEYWAWSASDFLSNATRGVFAEFLVAKALGISTATPRDEWADYDLLTPEGNKVEVKSGGYLQSWHHDKPSKISFSIRPSLSLIPETGRYDSERVHQAEFYIFALLHHLDKDTVNPLDTDQWTFYVAPTEILQQSGHQSITLTKLQELVGKGVPFQDLRAEFQRVKSRKG